MRTYTSRVERQVKERLVGAAVLVALAVILIPELLSGPGTKQKPTPSNVRNEQGLKTYEFKLDGTPARTPAQEAAPPAEQAAAPPAEHAEEAVTGAPPAEAPTEKVAQTPSPELRGGEEPQAATPPPIPSSPTPSSTASPASTAGWAVQLGSFADEERAKRLVAKLKDAGHNAYLVPLRRADGKTLQRVRIGPYAQRAAAEVALKKVASEAKGAAVISQP